MELPIKKEIENLYQEILEADKAYFVSANPIMSDSEYDAKFNRLVELEKTYPALKMRNSPTSRVGSDLDNSMPIDKHTIPVLSLDKAYSFAEVQNWLVKSNAHFPNNLEIVAEPKIDGAGVVLYYENGELAKVLTRGNGEEGNAITHNALTIGSIPKRISYLKPIAVRGEVYIEKAGFEALQQNNPEVEYANPRNLASGSLRRIKSIETAKVPLKLFVYECFGYEEATTHEQMLLFLLENGFPVNQKLGFFGRETSSCQKVFETTGELDNLHEYVTLLTHARESLAYEIDGIVFKINSLAQREELGYTMHHPRWAIALKFEAPVAATIVEAIDIQIGRGGRVTPVAILQAVELAGSVITRATLHNEEYIQTLGVGVGDTVAISKRGDVIPAVEFVATKNNEVAEFIMPHQCPVCNSELIKDGAHLFCVNKECKAIKLGSLQYFVGRNQMQVETLGDKTLEYLFDKGFVTSIEDLYSFDYWKLLGQEGFGEKKIQNIIDSLALSKEKDFPIVLASLGLKDIGAKTASLLTGEFHDIEKLIEVAGEKNPQLFSHIPGIGEGIAKSIIEHFNDESVLRTIEALQEAGLQFSQKNASKSDNLFLADTKWVITGSFENFKPREKAAEMILYHGGELLSNVSKKTTYLLCGKDAGSKETKARSLGLRIVNENEFLAMLENGRLPDL